ncbi:MAG TPA: four helix bundle protein [Chthoniobacterales bacterium]|nr:four helix bundle protein [Chthoniobacterales bacterium]
MKVYFDHEKLDVYREAIAYCAWSGELLNSIAAKAAAKDQLDRASTSIPLNIAEGNGKFSGKDRARFLEIARGSALECAACLDVLVARKLTTPAQIEGAKENLARIVQMLMGMLRRFSERGDFLREDEGGYGIEQEHEHEHENEGKEP